MHNAQTRLPPTKVISADSDTSLSEIKRAEALWNNLEIRSATAECMADSILTLAAIWQAAWDQGGGGAINNSELVTMDQTDLDDIYRKESGFLPRHALKAL